MTTIEVFDKTDDITHDFVGVFLGGDIRAGYSKYGWYAYIVTFNSRGNPKSVRVLRIRRGKGKGKPVKTMFFWEGIGDLVERIEKLYKAKQLQ